MSATQPPSGPWPVQASFIRPTGPGPGGGQSVGVRRGCAEAVTPGRGCSRVATTRPTAAAAATIATTATSAVILPLDIANPLSLDRGPKPGAGSPPLSR